MMIASILAALLVAPPPASAAPDLPFLESSPEALLAATDALTGSLSTDVVVIGEEGSYTFDDEGRRTLRYRLTYRVLTQAGLDSWKSLSAIWSPWHEERPSLRARVVRKDGSVFVLDPATIADTPVDSSDELLSDQRRLLAPLPGLAVGAIVERETVIRETRPMFDGGNVYTFYFGRTKEEPGLRTRLVIDAPQSLPIRFVKRRLELDPIRTEAAGRVRLVFETGGLEAEGAPADAPPDVPRWPRVSFSTGRSWQDVARRYDALVERRLADADLLALVQSTIEGATSAQEKAKQLLALVQREVRYTGIEFGEAAIVPQAPGETLRRRYGDCKDQATLLVGLLRKAGVPAHVALLHASSTPEAEDELPGLGLFNHAIVVIPGPSPVWIDPTARLVRIGQLPNGDQGRRALIVAPDSTGLVLTPEARAEDNRTVETREFHLALMGQARVVETTKLYGAPETSLRRGYDGEESSEIRERLLKYAKTEYGAKGLAKATWTDPSDIATPMQIDLEIAAASRGTTAATDAAVGLPAWTFIRDLPAPFQPKKEADGSSEEKARTEDYLFPDPYTYEWHYLIVPPPGFVVDRLPDSDTLHFGPVELKREFRSGTDHVVTARVCLTVGKRRLSADEFVALRDGARAFADTKMLLVTFKQKGEDLLASGRVREALEEFRQLAKAHPKEVRFRTQIARALLGGGLGLAAREAAAAAVQVDATSPLAHATLGWVLDHDLVGRHRTPGADHAGALAAYRKAHELDPEDAETRSSLAILLEYDDSGRRYAEGSHLAEAISHYRELRKVEGYTGMNANLLIALMWHGDFDGLLAEAVQMERDPTRDALVILAVAATRGVAAALERAQEIAPEVDKRRNAIAVAGSTLVLLRRYEEAASLLTEASRGATNSAELSTRADVLRQVKRFVPPPMGDDPVALARLALAAATRMVDGAAPDEFLALVAPEVAPEDLALEKGSTAPPSLVRALRSKGMPIDVAIDTSQTLLRFTAEGDPKTGYRVRSRGATAERVIDLSFYLVPRPKGLRVLSVEGDAQAMAREAWRRLDVGDLPSARQWLDWAREEVNAGNTDDPVSGHPFARLWTPGGEADESTLRLAAACLIVTKPTLPGVRELLEHAAHEAGDAPSRVPIESALAMYHFNHESFDLLLKLSDSLARKHPRSLTAFQNSIATRSELRDWEGAREVANGRLTLIPGDEFALRALASIAMMRGDTPGAAEGFRRLQEAGKADATDMNNLAWLSLTGKTISDEDIALARDAVSHSGGTSSASLNTLAALYAETGKVTEARETLLRSIEAGDHDTLRDEDWFVVGRLAEQYGVPEAAIEAYAKIGKTKDPTATSVFALAQRRLARLTSENEGQATR